MVKAVILAFRAASDARDVSSVVFTGVGDKAFCTGGNTKEYAEYYAGHPQEYRQYMRLFNDMVSAILACDKPVICRVNGMRIGGGQEIGMACDFSVAAGPRALRPGGPEARLGADRRRDRLPAGDGRRRAAMAACVLCEPFSAHKAYHMGVLTDIVPALKVDGKFVANPLVETQRVYDEFGRHRLRQAEDRRRARGGQGTPGKARCDLSMLDQTVEALCAKIAAHLPGLHHEDAGRAAQAQARSLEPQQGDARAWLALNMMTEARAGFVAFNEGPKEDREVDFVLLRQKLAAGEGWVGGLHDAIQPKGKSA
jgi:6-oxocyclohex-1-ene-carbonyl-CoA hydrolase